MSDKEKTTQAPPLKVRVRNRMNQPIAVDVGNGKSIHFRPQEIKLLTHEELNSPQVQAMLKNRYFVRL